MIRHLVPGVRVVLLDIEGTTTSIAFVHETLFPYARARLDRYLEAHWSDAEVGEIAAQLARERQADRTEAPPWRDDSPAAARASAAAYAHRLMDRDRKSPGLKQLQGLIWEDGYRAGELRGEVWDDVPAAMRRWHEAGLSIAIYSSGSELAQRRLFESTNYGDLTPLVTAFFDTAVGSKLSPASYRNIAGALDCEPREICFVSDVTAELRAAREAGCHVVLSVRPQNPPQQDANDFASIVSFEAL